MRKVDQWFGTTHDSRPPPRVAMRILDAYDYRCAKCGRGLYRRTDWELDHKIALINGGANIESNLWPLCVTPCHSDKTLVDLAEKARVAAVATLFRGVRKSKNPLPGSKGSGYRKKMDGTVIKVDE